jgi:integrase
VANHKLTATQISKTKPKDKPFKLSDGHGLFLYVAPKGGKLWRWSYRFNGAMKLMSFGPYPEITLEKARELHMAARRTLLSGIDPMVQKKEEKLQKKTERQPAQPTAVNTFRAVEAKWHEKWKVGKTERHAIQVQNRIDADIMPKLGDRPIAEIEPMEIVEVAKAIETRGCGDLAHRSVSTMGQIFRYAIANGLATSNPVSGVKPSDILKEVKEHNFARIGEKDVPRLMRAIEFYRGTPITRLALKLMALTFVRTSELLEAPWSEFDLDGARWVIPAERMKMGTPHIVPLAHQTIECLRTLLGFSGDTPWLFPGDRDRRKTMSNNTILKALERLGFKGEMTGHGFRGLASTILHEQEYLDEHIELQLAHQKRDKVAAAYNYAKHLGPRKKMMQDWADFLEQQRGAKVLKMVKG